MKEQDFQRRMVKHLEYLGAYVIKVIAASKKGVPDIIACYKGYFIAIEMKTPTTRARTSKLQDYNIKKIQEAKGYAMVAVEPSDIDPIIEEINNEG